MRDDLRKKAEELLKQNPEETPTLSTVQVQKLFHELDVHQIELQMQNDELRKTQAELAHSRDAYAELYDFAPVGYLIVDFESRILDANFTAATMLGTERGKLVGSTFAGFVSRGSLDAWDSHRRHILEQQQKQCGDLTLQRPDGSVFTAQIESAPRHESGRWLMTLTDISQQVQAEELAAEAAARWQTTFDAMADALFILDTHQRILLSNKAASAFFGYPAERMQGRPCWEIVHSTGGPVKDCPTRRMLESGRREAMELAVDDSCFQVTADPLKGKDGEICGAVHIIRDITGRKQAEDELRKSEQELAVLNLELEQRIKKRTAELQESEERFRTLFEEAPDACFLIGLNGVLMDGNKSAENLIGYPREELTGLNAFESGLLDADSRTLAMNSLTRLAQGEPVDPVELKLIHKDGTEITIEISTMLVQLQGQTVVLGSARDLTARRRAELDLQESEEKYRKVFESESDAIMIFDGETRQFIDINQAAEKKYGYTRAEFFALTHDAITAEPEASEATIKAILSEQPPPHLLPHAPEKRRHRFPRRNHRLHLYAERATCRLRSGSGCFTTGGSRAGASKKPRGAQKTGIRAVAGRAARAAAACDRAA